VQHIASSIIEAQHSCPFVDRLQELEALRRAHEARPHLALLYGRRRIGKTRLIKEWLSHAGEPAVYYMARLASHEYNLRRMAEAAASQLGDPLIARLEPRDLPSLLQLVHERGATTIVIDEVTYWARSWTGLASELQYFVDHVLPGTSLLLVLTGSLLGVMEDSLAGRGAPLYARAHTRIRLDPLRYPHAAALLDKYTPPDKVRVYSLLGGVPFHLCTARTMDSPDTVLARLLLSPHSQLRDEKDLILREEFRDPHSYEAILSAIAQGYDTPTRISQVTGLDKGHVSRYLARLKTLGLVEHEVPLFAKRGRYRIRDPILRAWYTIAEPLQELIDLGLTSQALPPARMKLERLAAQTWEDLARQHLLARYAAKGYTRAGRVERKGEELDIALLDEQGKKAVVGEAKWSRLTLREAERLRRRTLARAHRLLPDYEVQQVYIAARELEPGEKPSWIILPEDLEHA